MPYISQDDRNQLDGTIDELAIDLSLMDDTRFAGALNYTITRLLIKTTQERYASIALAMGTLDCVGREFYRRLVAPYEDKKCAENGDVYQC